ncbi:MAG: hypothetical protein A2340_05275 [Lentisphaerae bacterium RIFOXYB12_FULL_60_10]|nr:MAG: hypothetical protein A2340_05275 [Lentisphaerae bacterium RIFOXYB12_FULL_60_10]
MKALAHSARGTVPLQTYAAHVGGVVSRACRNAGRLAVHTVHYGAAIRRGVRLASEFHDLGKLDPENQRVLNQTGVREALPLLHWDCGAAYLLGVDLPAAVAVYSHHSGLPSFPAEENRAQQAFRIGRPIRGGVIPTCGYSDKHLQKYLQVHRRELSAVSFPEVPEAGGKGSFTGLFHRMLLACLVDADHGDSARHETGMEPPDGRPLEAGKRLESLRRYVNGLSEGKSDERTRMRQTVFDAALNADTTAHMLACDSPVGTGKTTAVMAHLLNAARQKGLRRVFVVLPYTNIINQSVETYHKSLVLEGEKTEDVVAAHHHRAEFDSIEARQYSFLWHAPVVVTTAVQFFETLAGANPSALRKLHQLPGSAIFIDEAHAALPVHLWPQAWEWMKELTTEWGCHCVLGSGSLSEFWRLPELVGTASTIPALLPASCRLQSASAEEMRVHYTSVDVPISMADLAARVHAVPGPRLLIVNTVQSAAVLAESFREHRGREHVEHLSTALMPKDREKTYRRIVGRLGNNGDEDWTLVATSCVEAGVDFSFASGFRERAGLVNLLQTAGRVNREGLRGDARIADFRLASDPLLREHPGFRDASLVLRELIEEGKVSPEWCLEALRRECQRGDPSRRIEEIRTHELAKDYPAVDELFRVIDDNTLTIVVDESLKQGLLAGKKCSSAELQQGSVRVRRKQANRMGIGEFPLLPGVFYWTLDYDGFLGYMAGVLRTEKFEVNGGGVI